MKAEKPLKELKFMFFIRFLLNRIIGFVNFMRDYITYPPPIIQKKPFCVPREKHFEMNRQKLLLNRPLYGTIVLILAADRRIGRRGKPKAYNCKKIL